jgi:N-methylhydantoinase B
MAFPGGAGYGDPLKRDLDQVKSDLRMGFITPEYASKYHNFNNEEFFNKINFPNKKEV